ncbi:MAG: acyltransferase, partial [Lachnospiraceae bacterium]|nr:acyltransferase [Lachnospiraceae bacterium]
MTEKRRWEEMDILRGMAILMVLLYHSIIVFPIDLHEIQWCKTLHTFLWTVQMPLFFLVSGFCYSFRGSYREYASRKCRRILIPHVVFSFLDILPRLIPNPLVHEQMDVRGAVVDFVFYGGSDWFLWTLFVISMGFPALRKLLCGSEKKRKAGVLIVTLLFLAKPYMTDFLLINMVCQYLWYFFLGYGLRRRADRLLPVLKQGKNLLPAFLWTAVCFAGFLICSGRGYFEPACIALELLCVLGSFVFFFGLTALCRGRLSDFLKVCGVWSLQMYLLDAYALVASRTLLVSILGIGAPAAIIAG